MNMKTKLGLMVVLLVIGSPAMGQERPELPFEYIRHLEASADRYAGYLIPDGPAAAPVAAPEQGSFYEYWTSPKHPNWPWNAGDVASQRELNKEYAQQLR